MAIVQADQASGAANFPPSSVAFTSPISVGDVLVCVVILLTTSSSGTQTISDTVNAGNYTLLNSLRDTTNASGTSFIYYKVATSTGTPTVSISQSSDQFGNIYIARYTGFTGTVTPDSTLNGASGRFTSASTIAVSCTPITTNSNNELLLGTFVSNPNEATTSATVTGWTQVNGSTFGGPFYYSVVPTSGTNNSFTATLNGLAAWSTVFAGLYGVGGGGGGNNQSGLLLGLL